MGRGVFFLLSTGRSRYFISYVRVSRLWSDSSENAILQAVFVGS